MGNDNFEQIKTNLSSKTSEELLIIWKENDRETWSEDAFKAIEQILTDRKILIPVQKQSSSLSCDIEKPKLSRSDAVAFLLIALVLTFLLFFGWDYWGRKILIFKIIPDFRLIGARAFLIFIILISLFRGIRGLKK